MQIGNLSLKPGNLLKNISDSIIREQLGEKQEDIVEKKEKIEKKPGNITN